MLDGASSEGGEAEMMEILEVMAATCEDAVRRRHVSACLPME